MKLEKKGGFADLPMLKEQDITLFNQSVVVTSTSLPLSTSTIRLMVSFLAKPVLGKATEIIRGVEKQHKQQRKVVLFSSLCTF